MLTTNLYDDSPVYITRRMTGFLVRVGKHLFFFGKRAMVKGEFFNQWESCGATMQDHLFGTVPLPVKLWLKSPDIR